MSVLGSARAPLRIGLAGGGTDLPPFVDEHGGVVVNSTITLYAHATLREAQPGVVRVKLDDHDNTATDGWPESIGLALFKACLSRLRDVDAVSAGLELSLKIDAPIGSGLGGSSATVVAMIGALMAWSRTPVDRTCVARLAWHVEREDVGIPGGSQDQYTASFGGLNLMEFSSRNVGRVQRIPVAPGTLARLQHSLVLVSLGRRRHSADLIGAQEQRYTANLGNPVAIREEMKQLAWRARRALINGNIAALGDIIHHDWMAKREMAPGISTPQADEIYREARLLGAYGGKLTGAGGGGCLLLCCPPSQVATIVDRLTSMEVPQLPFALESRGLMVSLTPSPADQTWP